MAYHSRRSDCDGPDDGGEDSEGGEELHDGLRGEREARKENEGDGGSVGGVVEGRILGRSKEKELVREPEIRRCQPPLARSTFFHFSSLTCDRDASSSANWPLGRLLANARLARMKRWLQTEPVLLLGCAHCCLWDVVYGLRFVVLLCSRRGGLHGERRKMLDHAKCGGRRRKRASNEAAGLGCRCFVSHLELSPDSGRRRLQRVVPKEVPDLTDRTLACNLECSRTCR